MTVKTSRALVSFLERMGEVPTGKSKLDVKLALKHLPKPYDHKKGVGPRHNIAIYSSGDRSRK